MAGIIINKVNPDEVVTVQGHRMLTVYQGGEPLMAITSRAVVLDTGGRRDAVTMANVNAALAHYNLGLKVVEHPNMGWMIDKPNGERVAYHDNMTFVR